MIFNLFKKSPVIDENTRQWLIDTFAWAIAHFDAKTFHHETQLILPNNDFYSGRVASIDEMAENIFTHTVNYAGMKNWPLRLLSPNQAINSLLPQLTVTNALRGEQAQILINDQIPTIDFTFNPQQINQPQDLIASYAQQLATVLVMQQKVLPPGGQETIPQAIDVLACVMGFGVIFANTAYQFRGGCGSCYNPRANRQAALPEHEMLYSLAIFCQLKAIPVKNVTPHLKSHLRSDFKRMVKDVQQVLPLSEQAVLASA